MKYLVVKGWLGFGDRLECLKMAVKYALDNNLQIYVDWTDRYIRHTDESFYTYFNLINMPTLNSLDNIPSDATYYPSYWKDNIHQPFTDELYNKRIELKLDLGILNEQKKFDADVIILSCFGNRRFYYESKFFANVFRVINPKIVEEVVNRQQKYNLQDSIGIHLRGTDRINYRTKQGRYLPIQYLSINVFAHGQGKKQIVVSDDNESIKFWKNLSPDSIVLSSLSLQNSHKGALHEITHENLKISKNDLNIDMLIDFFTLSSCERVLSTYRDSRFANESMRLHPHVNQILGISLPTPIQEVKLYTSTRKPIIISENSRLKLINGRFKMDI